MVNANSVFLRLFQDANHLSVQSSVSEAFVRSKLCYRLAEACDSIGGFADCRFVGDYPTRIDDPRVGSCPPFDVVLQEMRNHRHVALTPLIKRHLQCALHRSGDRMYLMGIDDQSLVEFLRSVRSPRILIRNRFARSVMTSLLITVGAPHLAERRPEDELLIVVESRVERRGRVGESR